MPAGKKRFYFLSLGCPKNDVDSDRMASALLRAGWEQSSSPLDAGLLVVNTCAFIASAVEESVESILDLADLREGGRRRLVVTGCLPTRYGAETLRRLLPEVDLFVDIPSYPRFASLVEGREGEEEKAPPSAADRTQAATLARGFVYLKIAEGCRRRCAYCAIPSIRGPLTSRPAAEIIAEARFFLARGARELVLVAQDTTSYGLDLAGGLRLPELIASLCALEGDFRIRVMYLHPEGLDRRLLESMREDRVCAYLDLPFQHVDPGVLAAMGRRGSAAEHGRLLRLVREVLGEAALRATFMVGFPGEDARSFLALYDFIAESRFDWVGLFGYSQEEGTPAFSLGKGVAAREKRRRVEALAELQEEIMREKAAGMVGRKLRVLVEGESEEAPGFWEARSFREAPDIDGVIFVKDEAGMEAGAFREVEITASEGIDLVGEVKDGHVGLGTGQAGG